MDRLKLIILLSLVGAALGFSFYPVLSGTDGSKNCEKTNEDCGLPEEKTARIAYITGGRKFNDPALSSRRDYCRITGTCTSETIAIPLSILIGVGVGATIGLVWSQKTLRKSK